MNYRPDIDALRAVAVLPVVLSHAGIPGLPAGFLGVDVFFVISGYLITSILLKELHEGQFSCLAFYERRARRILPALAFMLLLTLPAAWITMLPSQLKDFGQSIVATTAFSANVYFWMTQDYWAPAAEMTPLIHLWSLGIEEQFYLLFPFLLMASYRRPRVLFFSLMLLAVISLTLMVRAREMGHTASAFYLLPFRSWELLTGALAAIVSRHFHHCMPDLPGVAEASLATIVMSYMCLSPSTTPLLLYAPIVIATSFVLVLGRVHSPALLMLSAPAVVAIGKCSYSLYLFHQPVLAFMRLRFGQDLPLTAVTASLAVTAALSCASYLFVETPLRRRDAVPGKLFVAAVSTAFILLGCFGLLARRTNGFWDVKAAQMSPAGRIALAQHRDAVNERKTLWREMLGESSRPFIEANGTRVLFVGDSLSEDLYVAASLARCMPGTLQFRRIALDNECIESQALGRTGVNGIPCAEEMSAFRTSQLLRDSDCVVIAAAWLETAPSLTNFLDLPELRGKSVLLFEPHGFTDIKSLITYADQELLDVQSQAFREHVFVNRHHRTKMANAVLEQIAQNRRLHVYRGFDCFCDSFSASCVLFDAAGNPLIIDQSHLSVSGAQHMGPSLCNAIQRAIELDAAASP